MKIIRISTIVNFESGDAIHEALGQIHYVALSDNVMSSVIVTP